MAVAWMIISRGRQKEVLGLVGQLGGTGKRGENLKKRREGGRGGHDKLDLRAEKRGDFQKKWGATT